MACVERRFLDRLCLLHDILELVGPESNKLGDDLSIGLADSRCRPRRPVIIRRSCLRSFDPLRALAPLGSYEHVSAALDDRMERNRYLPRGFGYDRLAGVRQPRSFGVLVFRPAKNSRVVDRS